jgi:hypothetical protein
MSDLHPEGKPEEMYISKDALSKLADIRMELFDTGNVVNRNEGLEKAIEIAHEEVVEDSEEQKLEPAALVKIWEPSGLIEMAKVYDQTKFQTEEWDRQTNELKKYDAFLGRDIIQLIDNLLSDINEERFDSPKGAESVLLQLKSEIQSLEVEERR